MYSNNDIIDMYKTYLKRYRDSNENTIRNYIYDLKAFDLFLNGKHFFDVTEEDINRYIQDKKDNKKSPNRINFSISTLSSFYKYLVRNKGLKINPVENIKVLKVKKKEVEPLTLYQLYDIRKRLEEYGDTQLAVFYSIIVSGMPKKCCINNIQWRKIKWKEGYIEVDINEKERGIIYLDKYTLDLLCKLRRERKNKGIKKKWVFISRHKGHWNSLSDTTITNWLSKIKKIAELDELSFSILKKTTLKYWEKRKFSQEKVDALISYRSFPVEIRSFIIDELNNLYKNNVS